MEYLIMLVSHIVKIINYYIDNIDLLFTDNIYSTILNFFQYLFKIIYIYTHLLVGK